MDFAASTWTVAPNMSAPRAHGKFAAAVGDTVYAFGGWTCNASLPHDGYLSAVEFLAPGATSWAAAPSMHWPRAQFGATVLDGRIYVAGGKTDAPVNGSAFLKQLDIYDPVQKAWELAPTLPQFARTYAAVGSLDGLVYVAGGIARVTCVGSSLPSECILSSVESYNPATKQWAIEPNMPYNVSLASAHGAAGKLFVVGGLRAGAVDPTSQSQRPVGTVQIFDAKTRVWSLGPLLPDDYGLFQPPPYRGGRESFGMAGLECSIYVVAGGGHQRPGLTHVLRLDVTDLDKGWVELPPLTCTHPTCTQGRELLSAAIVPRADHATLFALGGMPGQLYEPATVTVEQLDVPLPNTSAAACPSARRYTCNTDFLCQLAAPGQSGESFAQCNATCHPPRRHNT
jgi:hypothetical protein